jgi:hypothetical protein
MEPTTGQPDYPRGITFDEVWAALKETESIVKANARAIEKLNEQMGGLHNKFGELAEHMVCPSIVERFNQLGFYFNIEFQKGFKVIDEQGKVQAEIDILLGNGEYIIAVEVKSDVKLNDIKHHINRLKLLRKHSWFKNNNDHKILGARAGAIFADDVKKEAINNGFYVLTQSGDTMKMEIPADFIPREF